MNSSRIRKKNLYINFLQWNWEPLLYEKQAYKKYQRNCNVEKKFWGLPSTFMQDVYSTLVLCSHEIKRCLLLGRKVMTNLDSIFQSRDITLLMKVRLVKAVVFPVEKQCMDVRVGLWGRLSAKKLMLLNCGVGEDSWESLGLQGDPISPF